MSELTIGILGLGRVGASIGLALKRYIKDGGKYRFRIVGYDTFSANEKDAQKMGAVDSIERTPENAVSACDVVVMALPYEDTKTTYQRIGRSLRDGVVILDTSPLKNPSFAWNDQYLTEEHHVIGVTPICNPKHLFDTTDTALSASEDYFDNGSFLITPAVNSVKEAVDLAFNFCALLGGKPRFLDPTEHDNLLAQTEQLPQLLGVALYHYLMSQPSWSDTQWFTNPTFGSITRPLKDKHPDAMRDAMYGNAETLARTLDSLIGTLAQVRDALRASDRATLEALLADTAEDYAKWINRRHANDWDKDVKPPTAERAGMMSMIFGQRIAGRLKGKK
jgi:prephenate dehydrogenase